MTDAELHSFITLWRRPVPDRWGHPIQCVIYVRAVHVQAATELAPVAFEQIMGATPKALGYQLVEIRLNDPG